MFCPFLSSSLAALRAWSYRSSVRTGGALRFLDLCSCAGAAEPRWRLGEGRGMFLSRRITPDRDKLCLPARTGGLVVRLLTFFRDLPFSEDLFHLLSFAITARRSFYLLPHCPSAGRGRRRRRSELSGATDPSLRAALVFLHTLSLLAQSLNVTTREHYIVS